MQPPGPTEQVLSGGEEAGAFTLPVHSQLGPSPTSSSSSSESLRPRPEGPWRVCAQAQCLGLRGWGAEAGVGAVGGAEAREGGQRPGNAESEGKESYQYLI